MVKDAERAYWNSPLHPDQRGFTVWELLIVVAIIAVLATLTLPPLPNIKNLSQTGPLVLAAADKEINKLTWQQMVYTTPEHMEIGSTVLVEVALGGNKSFVDLMPLLEEAGKTAGAKVRVSDRMEARLTGSGFDIAATTPETQLVSSRQPTIWQWQVTAKNLGNQTLYLSLNALLTVNGKEATKSVRTFHRDITVEVTSVSGAWAFVERYWIYLAAVCSAVMIPLAVYVWKKVTKSNGGEAKE